MKEKFLLCNSKINVNKIENVIFDFDGVIADTDSGRFNLLQDLLKEYNLSIEDKFKPNDLSGLTTRAFLKKAYPILTDNNIDLIIEKRHSIFLSDLNKYCKPFDGVVEFIKLLYSLNKKLYLASTNDFAIIDILLNHLEIKLYFPDVFGRETTELPDGKKTYKKLIEYLNLDSEKSMVIEDSENGIKAAKHSKLFCIAFNPDGNEIIKNLADSDFVNYKTFSTLFI